jgi:hypothetical protein
MLLHAQDNMTQKAADIYAASGIGIKDPSVGAVQELVAVLLPSNTFSPLSSALCA